MNFPNAGHRWLNLCSRLCSRWVYVAGGGALSLTQPSEVLIIFGSALGALIIANPMSVIKNLISQITGVFKGGLVKQDYEDLLVMMFEVFNISRRDGLVGLESHIEKP